MELQAKLKTELDRVMAELGGEISGTPIRNGHGRAPSPNGDAAILRNRVRQLEHLLDSLPEVDPGSIHADGAGFGSTVTLLDLDKGGELVYTMLTGDHVDPDQGEVSLASPIGHALLGRRKGDEVEVATPRGNRRFRVLGVTTLPHLLGLSGSDPLPTA